MKIFIALTTSPFFGLQIFIFLRYNTAFLTILVVSPPVDQTQLHFLRLPVVVVYDLPSSLSSLTSSPSSPSHRLGRLRLHLRLVVFAVFVSSSSPSLSRRLRRLCLVVFAVFVCAITLSPASPSPFTREFTVDRRSGIVLFCILTRWLPPRLRPIFVVACRDRPQWPSPQGALGNAPVGTSLCRCGGGFLRVCIPCNGFRHHVSPDLSSDKSHLVRDPYDVMRSNCSLSNLRVAWPGSQRWWNCWEEVGQ
ncbi:hypothetical protein OUZ56_027069 [Daphnia magna]|uniref:Uncharacterized protein n=1 Tax=Daphnia magna TaxID=35525 RepID=A0ABQ9ZNN1_9CRUS|nr:hypothetical protein OUZ56_027069 [Daphnia magna]